MIFEMYDRECRFRGTVEADSEAEALKFAQERYGRCAAVADPVRIERERQSDDGRFWDGIAKWAQQCH